MAAKKTAVKKKAAKKRKSAYVKKALPKKNIEGLEAIEENKVLNEEKGYKYHPSFCEMAGKLAKLGAIDEDFADFFNVNRSTIHRWRVRHPAFKKAIELSKEMANELVERSLFQRAIGYSHPEVRMFQHEGKIIKEETIKHYPPDTHAVKFWLYNREPDIWREKVDHEMTGKDGQSLIPSEIKVIYE